MSQAAIEYVYKTPQGGWRIADSRVSLDSVIHGYFEGQSPEEIALEFPTLSAEQVYGAIAFYLHNRTEIDAYLAEQDARWQELADRRKKQNDPLLNRLRSLRQQDAEDA